MMYTNIFDSHAHYDDIAFDDDRDDVLNAVYNDGIKYIVDPACDLSSCNKTLEISNKYNFVYSAVGIHPEAAETDAKGDWLSIISSYAKSSKVVAIGEIGLDYHYDNISRDIQIEVFKKQLALSLDLNLPVIIHDREAHQDTLELVKHYRPKGIIHCFSGSAEMAQEFLKLGMFIGFTGSVTFKNANKLLLAAQSVPLDKILLETDSPYLSPVPFRGTRCDSRLICFTAEKIAELKNIDTQELINCCTKNTKEVYEIK